MRKAKSLAHRVLGKALAFTFLLLVAVVLLLVLAKGFMLSLLEKE